MLKEYVCIGLYSDTAIASVDACIFKTDGLDILSDFECISRPYPDETKQLLHALISPQGQSDADLKERTEKAVTQHHIETVQVLLERVHRTYPQVDLIGFPGHTILHQPEHQLSVQIGDAQALADAFGCTVVTHFVQADLLAGGSGGPVFPAFYEALTRSVQKPIAVVTLGGVANVTWIGPLGELQSFDIGAGNILLDTWVQKKANQEMDFNGTLGAKGHIDAHLLSYLMKYPFLEKKPPKTLDRNDFNDLLKQIDGLNAEDGAATLTAFIAGTVQKSAQFFKEPVHQWIVTGGGSFNPTLVQMIRHAVKEPVISADEMGWNKDMLEAECYGFLAARCVNVLPITFPETTGIKEPLSGGLIIRGQNNTEHQKNAAISITPHNPLD